MGFSRQEHWSGVPSPSPIRESEVAQSCPTLRDPMDCSLLGSSIHGTFQARALEWGAIALSDLPLLLQYSCGQRAASRGGTPFWVWGQGRLPGGRGLRADWQAMLAEAEGSRLHPRSTIPSVMPVSGSLGFLVHPCLLPTPSLPGTLTGGRAAAWNPLPGVTRQTELHRTLSLFSGWATCAPHLLPSWPAWVRPPPPYAAPQTLLRTHSSPRRLQSPGPGCH